MEEAAQEEERKQSNRKETEAEKKLKELYEQNTGGGRVRTKSFGDLWNEFFGIKPKEKKPPPTQPGQSTQQDPADKPREQSFFEQFMKKQK